MLKVFDSKQTIFVGGGRRVPARKAGSGHRSRLLPNICAVVCAFLAFAVMPFAAAEVASMKTDAGNVYLSGDEVRIIEPVSADLFAAGRRVSIEHSVGADGMIAGATVDVRSDIGQDLRIAGGSVNIDGGIGGDLLAAGGRVIVAKTSAVSGTTLIAGREVSIDGRLAQGTKIYARRISISGQIAGDTRLYGQEVALAPGAKIDGDLIYTSANPLSAEQLAQVSGKVVRESTPEGWKTTSPGPAPSGAWFRPIFFLGMLASGSLLFILVPNAVTGAGQTIKHYPLRSLLIGLALLFTLPPVAILFMITVIGIPIGLALLMLYPLLFLLGYLATAFFIGRETANAMNQPKDFTFGRQIVFLAIALLILAIVTMIPVLGWLLVFLALVTGIGGWAVWLHQRYRGETPREASDAAV